MSDLKPSEAGGALPVNGLPAVYRCENRQLQDARELHQFIEIQQKFADWIKGRIEKYGFIEKEDFFIILGKSSGGRPTTEYGLTIDTAKELCMVENNEKGRIARRYFIECERKAKAAPAAPQLPTAVELAKWFLEANARAEKLEIDLLRQETRANVLADLVDDLKPKADLMEKVIEQSNECIDVGQAAKILALPYGRNKLFEVLRQRGIFFKERNEPQQKYIKAGYFRLKEKWIERNNHDGFCVVKVLITQKGLSWLAQELEVVKTPPRSAELE